MSAKFSIVTTVLFFLGLPIYVNAQVPGGGPAAIQNLQDQIDALKLNTVTADCGADPAALQLAIDETPASGILIDIIGACDAAIISGKRNVFLFSAVNATISGDVTDSSNAALAVLGSEAIQIANVTILANGDDSALYASQSDLQLSGVVLQDGIDSVHFDNGSTALFSGVTSISTTSSDGDALRVSNGSVVSADGNFNVDNGLTSGLGNAISLEVDSSFNQAGGTLTVNGPLVANGNSAASVHNGSIDASTGNGAFSAFHNSSIRFRPGLGETISLTAQGALAFVTGGSDIRIDGSAGAVTLTGGFLLLSRLSSIFIVNPPVNPPSSVTLDIGTLTIRQNAVLDINGTLAYTAIPTIALNTGAGIRNTDTLTVLNASCDATVWVDDSGITC